MPSKKDLTKARRRGYEPFAITQAMVNKGQVPASKKERTVKAVTASVLHKKPTKSCGKTKK